MSAWTSTSVEAGRMRSEDLAMHGDDLGRARDVGDEHPGPDDVRQGEAGLAKGGFDDREDLPSLAADVAGVP